MKTFQVLTAMRVLIGKPDVAVQLCRLMVVVMMMIGLTCFPFRVLLAFCGANHDDFPHDTISKKQERELNNFVNQVVVVSMMLERDAF